MTIQYKNAGINLSSTDTTSVLTAPDNARILIKQIQIDNTSSNPVNLSVQVTDTSATASFRISGNPIPATTTKDLITQTLVLEESDILKMTAGTAGELQGIISYAQIDRSQENG
jgi:F420-0:gamma-glutamyl ligase|tara:strand:- start:1740 stop:2081 length:342 start_codon:yes stop_codon:yes gene_type:complete